MPEEVREDPQPGGKENNTAVLTDEDIDVVGEGDDEADDAKNDHDPRLD